jgi:nucleoid DNA-binding protein
MKESIMNLNQLAEDIAAKSDTSAKTVRAVQKETFRQLRAMLQKGERVRIAEFGIFSMKDVPAKDGQPARKVLRFREMDESSPDAKQKKGNAEGKNRKRQGANGSGAEAAAERTPAK